MSTSGLKYHTVLKQLWLQCIFASLVSILIILDVNGIHPLFYLISFLSEAPYEKGLGYLVIVFFSFLENLFMVNVFFPGALIILATMGATHGHPHEAFLIFSCIYLPSIAAHIINFFWGRLTKRKTDPVANKHRVLWWGINMSHPNFASIYTFRAGNSAQPFASFLCYFIPWGFTWYALYGLLMYFFSPLLGDVRMQFPIAFIIYLIGWILISTIKTLRKEKNVALR